MNQEKAKYIIKYFSHLLTDSERLAIKHTHSSYKIQQSTFNKPTLTRIYKEKGWISDDQSVLDLLKDGYEVFEINIASRILTQNPGKIFLNNCPNCQQLARTPNAQQCRHCGHSWHV